MKTIYGIKREIFKGNKSMPEETITYGTLYKTLEEATKVMLKDADSCVKYDYHQPGGRGAFTTTFQTVHNSKTGKDTIYRHEWNLIKFSMEEEQ
jgi:hypothetical protein